jgi:hypothetical protein
MAYHGSHKKGGHMRPNPTHVEGNSVVVSLTQGQATIVDLADLERLQQFRWYALWNTSIRQYYVVTQRKKDDGKLTTLYLHRHLMDPPKGMTVDHINHDTLDNRRQNLRIVTNQVNNWNRNVAPRGALTGIMGVTIRKARRGKYVNYYYIVQVKRGEKNVTKLFPFTPEGLIQAMHKAIEARAAFD